jgi:hypothetical protein
VKQNDLGEYEENAREKQKIQVYKENHRLPLKPSHRDDKHQAPPYKEAKREESRGLVKMSASCLSVLINFICISPFSTWSLKKWCLTLMCLALPWKTGLWTRHMALELSHMRGTLL